MRMIRGFLTNLLLLIAVVTALLQPHDDRSKAAAKDSWESNSPLNITYGCVGLHCHITDDVEANLFMDQHGLSRMLLDPGKTQTSGTGQGGKPFDCPPNQPYTSTSCLPRGSNYVCPNSPYLRAPDHCK